MNKHRELTEADKEAIDKIDKEIKQLGKELGIENYNSHEPYSKIFDNWVATWGHEKKLPEKEEQIGRLVHKIFEIFDPDFYVDWV
jgi:hypothetical protein